MNLVKHFIISGAFSVSFFIDFCLFSKGGKEHKTPKKLDVCWVTKKLYRCGKENSKIFFII